MSGEAGEYLRTHRAHDYEHLAERWQTVAAESGLSMEAFTSQEEYPVFLLRSPTPSSSADPIYLSAGVHGDEPAAVIGLLEWAEENTRQLSGSNILIIPCFNPWGLVTNSRVDADGRDLNRLFHAKDEAMIREWHEVIADRNFRLALTLHEDYDAQGVYIYEISNRDEHIAHRMLQEANSIMNPDPRSDIDGSEAADGVIHRDVTPETFPLPGLPEAVYLHFHHAETTMTIETPSEFSLYDRVRLHRSLISSALRHVGACSD